MRPATRPHNTSPSQIPRRSFWSLTLTSLVPAAAGDPATSGTLAHMAMQGCSTSLAALRHSPRRCAQSVSQLAAAVCGELGVLLSILKQLSDRAPLQAAYPGLGRVDTRAYLHSPSLPHIALHEHAGR